MDEHSEGGVMVENPCPWLQKTPEGEKFCEFGPAGHAGPHAGNRTKQEYFRLWNLWLSAQPVKPGSGAIMLQNEAGEWEKFG